jgi:hypothetical protein
VYKDDVYPQREHNYHLDHVAISYLQRIKKKRNRVKSNNNVALPLIPDNTRLLNLAVAVRLRKRHVNRLLVGTNKLWGLVSLFRSEFASFIVSTNL